MQFFSHNGGKKKKRLVIKGFVFVKININPPPFNYYSGGIPHPLTHSNLKYFEIPWKYLMGLQKPKCLSIARSPSWRQIIHLPTRGLCQILFNIKMLDQGKDIQMPVLAADIPPNLLGYSQQVLMHLLPKLFSSSCSVQSTGLDWSWASNTSAVWI